MPSYLVSFSMPSEQYGIKYGSHLIMLDGPPRTVQAVKDLQTTLAMDYACRFVALLNWDLLPDADAHPGVSPYCYFVTYAFTGENGTGIATSAVVHNRPIRTLEDVRHLEKEIGEHPRIFGGHLVEIHLLSCKPMAEAPANLLDQPERTPGPENE